MTKDIDLIDKWQLVFTQDVSKCPHRQLKLNDTKMWFSFLRGLV